MRYAWDQYWDYFPKGLKEKIFFPWIHRLRQWDTSSQLRVDTFLANSEFVARRIRKYYRRDAAVVHPFVDLDFYQPREEARNQSYLVVSALVPYKRVDLAIEACRSLKKKLVIVGRGPEERRLKRLARGSDTTFLGSQPKEALKPLYSQCRGLLFPGVEDFGIVPLEAMACGTPVIALGRGGVLETVVEGRTGVFFEEPTVESLVGAILKFEKTYFSEDDCVSRAREFSKKRFQEEFQKYITIKI
jgi:glycosyltransferase involved in cell wall biosynthesis